MWMLVSSWIGLDVAAGRLGSGEGKKERRKEGKKGRRTRIRIRIAGKIQQSGFWVHNRRGRQQKDYYGRCTGLRWKGVVSDLITVLAL